MGTIVTLATRTPFVAFSFQCWMKWAKDHNLKEALRLACYFFLLYDTI